VPDNDRTDLDWEDIRYFVALARYGTSSERMRTDSASQDYLPDLTSQDYLRNPAAGLAKLRAAGPIVEVRFPIFGKTWITTTHDFADRVLKDSETFTMRKNGRVAGWLMPCLRWLVPGWIRALAVSMLSMDEPDHKRLRGIVDEAFRRRAILEMEPRIFAIADELATDLFADGSPADLVERYARTLPLLTICELLGLPRADRPWFIAWADSVTRLAGMRAFFGMMAGMEPMKRYLEGRLQAARETGGEGLIAELVRVEKAGGRISGQEMVAMIFLLLGAGSETTTHLISGSVYEILRAPKLRDWLEEDWNRADLAVEEFLRFVSPVQFTKPRFVRKDIDLGGVHLRKGDRIIPMLAAANMDPEANPHPEKLDLARRPNRHMSFGTGIHFCLGHQLARMECKCALEALFKRWPQLELALPPDSIRWNRRRPGLRAIEKLPVAIRG
jgi:cytochrome P450 PksS